MSYIEDNLMPGEEVVYCAKKHWKVFALPCLLGLVGLAFLIASLFVEASKALAIGGAIFVVIAIILAISPLTDFLSSEFAVTNKRVLIKVGFIQRHSLELMLTKVEGIGVDQGIMGRILNYGTIYVSGTGGTKEAFRDIAKPLEFRRQVQSRVPGE